MILHRFNVLILPIIYHLKSKDWNFPKDGFRVHKLKPSVTERLTSLSIIEIPYMIRIFEI